MVNVSRPSQAGAAATPNESSPVKPRTAVLPSIAAVALALPATAPAASLSVDRSCYGPGERVKLSGGGYTANGPVALSVSGRQLGIGTANAVGELAIDLPAPSIQARQRTDTFVATDQTNLSLTATAAIKLTSLDVDVTPKNGNPAKAKRVVARGFTRGRTLYAHVRRGSSKRNVKVGRLKGACGTLNVKRRLFPANAKSGVYNVQFDTKRTYSAKTAPQVAFVVTVFQFLRPASASAAATSWIRVG